MNRGIAILTVLAMASACGGRPARVAPGPIRAGHGSGPDGSSPDGSAPAIRRVGSVTVEGNRAFSTAAILAKLHYGQGNDRLAHRVYDLATLKLDEKRVAAFYRARGYFSARVTSRVSPAPPSRSGASRSGPGQGTADAVAITIFIDEGTATRVNLIAITGWPARIDIDAYSVLDSVRLRRKDILVHENYLVAKQRLLDALEASGYIYARVDGKIEVDRQRYTANVAFDIDTGPVVRFGKTRIRGNHRIPSATIRTRLAWRKGDVYSVKKLRTTRKDLYELGQFSSVHIEPAERISGPARDGRPTVIDIAVQVREGKRYDVKLGGGLGAEGLGSLAGLGIFESLDTRVEVHGRAELTVYRFIDPLLTFRAGLRPGYVVLPGIGEERSVVYDARGELTRQDFLWPRLAAGAFAAYTLDRFDAYATTGPSGGLNLERLLWNNRIRISVGVEGQWLQISPATGIDFEQLGTSDPLGIVFLQQSVSIDRRDDRLQPNSGWYAEQRWEEGISFADSQGPYGKTLTDVRGYVPWGQRLVVAGRVRAGFLFTASGRAGGLDTSGPSGPLTQRFFSGGSSTHRGFALRRLSPVIAVQEGNAEVATSVPIGGNALIEASAGLRVRLVQWTESALGLVFFVDAGDVTESASTLDPTDVHVALGVGLRYFSPLLPIRFDLAYRANRRSQCTLDACPDPDPDKSTLFHFSIGEAF